jgi:transcriptional regulator with XRE-family HTH domain
MKNKELHWTFESEVNLRTRIASDFLAQIEEKIAEKDWTHAEIAEALGVTEGRISQVFNNPGNLTLKTMMKMAEAVVLLVSVVAYNLGEKAQETGPVASGVFDACWKKLKKPMTHWDLEELTVSYKRIGTRSEPSCQTRTL